MREMVGIADAHGIESFHPLEGSEKDLFMLQIRASANRQRHAVVFKVMVDEDTEAAVEAEIKGNDFVKALEVLKEKASEVSLVNVGSGNAEKSWRLIPNHDLDPWY